MLKIGLTGGIGSGKSTIAKIIETLGYPVYISDSKASELINRDKEIKKRLTELFGNDIYQPDGLLNKKRLAEIIFNDKEAIKQVIFPLETDNRNSDNKILCPYLFRIPSILRISGKFSIIFSA